jgi:hypothetical protein
MYSQALLLFIFVTLFSPIYSDTRGLYDLQPDNPSVPDPPVTPFAGENPRYYDTPLISNDVANRRSGFDLWNPISVFKIEYLVQPAIICFGALVGIFGYFTFTEWLYRVLTALRKGNWGIKKLETDKVTEKAEETNEVERKKRMISAEVRTGDMFCNYFVN